MDPQRWRLQEQFLEPIQHELLDAHEGVQGFENGRHKAQPASLEHATNARIVINTLLKVQYGTVTTVGNDDCTLHVCSF